MMRDLRGDRLGNWMHRVQADDLPPLHSFVSGIKRDQDAVTRIELLKRLGYGRANLDLLRRRILQQA